MVWEYAFEDTSHSVTVISGTPYSEIVSGIRSGSDKVICVTDHDGVGRCVTVSQMTKGSPASAGAP